MYNIKQAAGRAGVSVPVLRAWERRYGIVRPARSASGYRRFDDDDVARIRTMRTLVDEGWSPSAAAAAILAGEKPIERSADPRSGGADRPDLGRVDSQASDLPERFVRAARELDPSAVELVLDDLFSRGSFELVAQNLLFPALVQLGDAWAHGDVSVAGEHIASSAALRRLGLALEAAGRTRPDRPRVLIGLPPGARHELGALAFAVAAQRAGLAVTYLGPDLPVDDWVTAAATADVAVVGVVTTRDRRGAIAVAEAIRASHPHVATAFGGGAAPAVPGVGRLPSDIAQAVGEIERLAG